MKQAERQLDQEPDEAEKSVHERGNQPENEEQADDAAEKSKTHQGNHSFGGGWGNSLYCSVKWSEKESFRPAQRRFAAVRSGGMAHI